MRVVQWAIALPFKLIGWTFLALAIAALAYDAWAFVATDAGLRLTPLGELWFQLSRDTLNLVQAAMQRGVHPVLWDPAAVALLQLPAPLALALVGLLALLIGRLIYR